ncbi:MAG TPA: PD-(D/E)XK nuclease family protein [Brevibacterium senegalense]|uniref:DNA 3'-5' helicase n=1 Tax=Brevibacterium senegalense TaxID=1033736 RepID=A0A921MCI2_9MICO|nr:PD-(D/E)XK nuclease family protein [Brevibacterium senegalense]
MTGGADAGAQGDAQDAVPQTAEAQGAVAQETARLLAEGRAVSVVAAPGAGLTRSLVEAQGRLLTTHGLAPSDVLVLTPTRAHADVLRDRLSAGSSAVRVGGAGARSVQSFAFGLVAADSAVRLGEPLRFLSGADQDAVLASLLEGYATGRAPDPGWPESFTPAMTGTVAFRDQLRDALDRVLERGAEPTDIDAAATRAGRPEWAALARILQDYRDVTRSFAGYGGIDTSGVLDAALDLIRDERATGTVAGRPWSFAPDPVPRCVLVDAAQDVSDAALGLLEGFRSLGCGVAVFGSPDSSTQGFRGAGGGLVADWAASVRTSQAGTGLLVLPARSDQARGTGAARDLSLALSRRISAHLELGHIPRRDDAALGDNDAAASHDDEGPRHDDATLGHDRETGSRVRVLTHRSAADRSRHVASIVRGWYHDEGVAFDDIAVIARTSGTAVALRAELGALGLPVESTDLPLSADPATLPLLTLLTGDLDDPDLRSALLRDLLTGVYGDVDALALRGLERQALRAEALQAEAQDGPAAGHGSADTSAAATAAVDGPAADPLVAWIERAAVQDLPAPLARAATLLEHGASLREDSAHGALWTLWEATGVATAWRDDVLRDPRSPLRERLDAVVRLFALAMKTEESQGLSASAFAQRVLDQVYAQDSLGVRDSLPLVTVDSPAGTAHRDFSRVIVVDVDEGRWPNPRIRRNAFHPDELLTELLDPQAAATVDAAGEDTRRRRRRTIRDEASLFLAAASRARDELVVCAVDDGDSSPSALHHLCRDFDTVASAAQHEDPHAQAADAQAGIDVPTAEGPDGELPARLRDIVGLARRRLLEAEDPADWARLVAALAAMGLREAHPRTWSTWFQVSSDAPAHAADEPVRIRPSQVERFATCPLQWFLVDAGGGRGDTTAATMGTAVHAIAEHHTAPDRAAMMQEFLDTFDLEQVPSAWEREALLRDVEGMIDTLCAYLASSRDELDALAAAGHDTRVLREVRVRASSPPGSPGGPWTVTGRIDRLEVLGDTARTVDFKTGKNVPSAAEIAEDPQLLVYQLAVTDGRLLTEDPDDALPPLSSAGAQIVKLRGSTQVRSGVPGYLRQQPAMEAGDPAHRLAAELVETTAQGMRQSAFTAVTGPHCTFCPVRASCPAVAAVAPEGASL